LAPHREDDTEITRTQRASQDRSSLARGSPLPKVMLALMVALAAAIVVYMIVYWFRR
jgi:hypothetical protein